MTTYTSHIPTLGMPRIKTFSRDYANSTTGVYVYGSSSEDMCLQIRGEKRFSYVSLSAEEARLIAAKLIAAADTLDSKGFAPAVLPCQ